MRRLVRSLAVLIAFLLVSVGSAVVTPALAQRTDTVVIGTAQEPDTLIGDFGSMLVTTNVLGSLFAYMVQRDDQGKLFPRMVERIPTLKGRQLGSAPGQEDEGDLPVQEGILLA